MTIDQERIDILTQSAEQRERDVMHYQINIDNFTRAIAEIEASDASAEMQAFAEHLRGMLASSKLEQAKERLMLKVIRDQLEES